MRTKTPEKKASAGKTNALQKPLQPSEELAAVVGSNPPPRGQVVSKMWEYIRSHGLQNPDNRREILADDKLRRVFGKDKVTMFEMNKHLTGHLKGQRRQRVRVFLVLRSLLELGGQAEPMMRQTHIDFVLVPAAANAKQEPSLAYLVIEATSSAIYAAVTDRSMKASCNARPHHTSVKTCGENSIAY